MNENNLDIHLTEDELIKLAKKRLAIKKVFFTHFGVYCAVNTGLFGLNFVGGGPLWALWPLFGWGIGLGCHWVTTVVRLNLNYKTDRLQKEIDYLRNKLNDDRVNDDRNLRS